VSSNRSPPTGGECTFFETPLIAGSQNCLRQRLHRGTRRDKLGGSLTRPSTLPAGAGFGRDCPRLRAAFVATVVEIRRRGFTAKALGSLAWPGNPGSPSGREANSERVPLARFGLWHSFKIWPCRLDAPLWAPARTLRRVELFQSSVGWWIVTQGSPKNRRTLGYGGETPVGVFCRRSESAAHTQLTDAPRVPRRGEVPGRGLPDVRHIIGG
jgi:hypothetical protein